MATNTHSIGELHPREAAHVDPEAHDNLAVHNARLMRDAKLGLTVQDWEEPVLEMADMAEIAAEIAANVLSDQDPQVTHAQARQMLFCVYHLQKMIQGFRETFYAALEAS